jgi:hypothetical protein
LTPLGSLALATLLAQAPLVPLEGYGRPPPGSPADQQLWRDLQHATSAATLAMGRLSQCSFRITYGKYYEGLDAILKDGPDAEKAEARALREHLAAEAKAADAAVPERPGVRECQYVLRDLGLFMPVPSDPRAKRQLPEVRRRAGACVEKLAPLAERVGERATALEGALAAIDAYRVRNAAGGAAAAANAPAGPPAATQPAAPLPATEAKP